VRHIFDALVEMKGVLSLALLSSTAPPPSPPPVGLLLLLPLGTQADGDSESDVVRAQFEFKLSVIYYTMRTSSTE